MEITLNEEQRRSLGYLIAQGLIARLQGDWCVPHCLDEFLFLVSDNWLCAIYAHIDETFEDVNPDEPECVDWMRLKQAIDIELEKRGVNVDSD